MTATNEDLRHTHTYIHTQFNYNLIHSNEDKLVCDYCFGAKNRIFFNLCVRNTMNMNIAFETVLSTNGLTVSSY